MKRFIETPPHYPNIWSKWIFQDSWYRQFHIPVPHPPVVSRFLRLLETRVLRPDISAVKIEKPVFLIGPPRSGTTMLQDLMVCHDRIAYMMHIQNSFHEAVYAVAWLQQKLNLNMGGERYLQDSIYGDVTTAAEPSIHWGKWLDRAHDELVWPARDAAFFTPRRRTLIESTLKKIILWWSRTRKNPRFFCKYPAFTTEIPALRLLFPDARFVHIIRDGRLTANSMLKLHLLTARHLVNVRHPLVKELIPYPRVPHLQRYIREFGPASLETTARVWSDCLDIVEEEKAGKSDIFDVRYEDILANPGPEMARIWEFCELDPPGPENAEYQRLFREIGAIRHANAYRDFGLVEAIAGRNLRKHGYL